MQRHIELKVNISNSIGWFNDDDIKEAIEGIEKILKGCGFADKDIYIEEIKDEQ